MIFIKYKRDFIHRRLFKIHISSMYVTKTKFVEKKIIIFQISMCKDLFQLLNLKISVKIIYLLDFGCLIIYFNRF